jgi:hypothetical protein
MITDVNHQAFFQRLIDAATAEPEKFAELKEWAEHIRLRQEEQKPDRPYRASSPEAPL